MKGFPLSFVVSAQQTVFSAVGKGRSVEEWVAELAATGYHGIELAVRRPAELDADAVRKACGQHGIRPVALGTGQAFNDEGLSLTDPDAAVRKGAVDRLKEHITLAAELGLDVVIVGLIRGRSSPGMDPARCLELVEGALKDLAQKAGPAGVRIAVEPINRYETDLLPTLGETAELLERVGWEAVGLLPDIFHMNIEEADPLTELERWGGAAVHFHAADSNRWAPGYGHLDLRNYFLSLTRSGYDGFVSVECLSRPDHTHRAAMATLTRLGIGSRQRAAVPAHTLTTCGPERPAALKTAVSDNVAVCTADAEAGSTVAVEGTEIRLVDRIGQGHKVALCNLPSGSDVIRYGQPIGRTSKDVRKGEHVHIHNLPPPTHRPERVPFRPGAVERPAPPKKDLTFGGYVRENGAVGTRNEIWIIPTVGCMAGLARELARRASPSAERAGLSGVRALAHPLGCSQLGEDGLSTAKMVTSLAHHPNAGGVLLLGLGCENTDPEKAWEELEDIPEGRRRLTVGQKSSDPWAEALTSVHVLIDRARGDERSEVGLDKLVLGVKCGGSDGLSGVTANPVLGLVSDRLGGSGGTVLMGEVPEVFGAEHVLSARAESEEVNEAFWNLVQTFRQDMEGFSAVSANPSPGNYAGGLSSLTEKSLGCVQKAGRVPLAAVLPYASAGSKPGLNLVASPGNDLVSGTALVAAGAVVTAFTTGRGTPMGLLVPTVKISSNSALAERHPGWIDFDAGALTRPGGVGDPQPLAEHLLELILEVASGRPTAAERRNDAQLAFWKRGVTL